MKRISHLDNLLIAGLLICSLSACNRYQSPSQELQGLIPKPVSLHTGIGHFKLTPETRILIGPGITEAEGTGNYLAEEIQKLTGSQLKVDVVNEPATEGNAIIFSTSTDSVTYGMEGYTLNIQEHQVEITAAAPAGLFYGVQTLLQLLPANPGKGDRIILPSLAICDKPTFSWRGMHLDVSRHFFPVEFIKEYIDILAMHKMNVFHWHLVDDQGWRIEIKKYPLLTEKAAWREGTGTEPWDYFIGPAVEGKPKYGGFYTQDEIRDIVRYAAGRYVTVVPEIEMPGHERNLLDAYPELYCSGRPFQRDTTLPWEFTDPFCAGNEKTFEFLENVLSEVIELFPSEYIHIGGDEAKKTPWGKCSKCQVRMRKEGLKNVEELQSYFISRIGRFLESKNRKMIGWDEIMEGGLAPGAIVMSWRGEEGGIEAAQLGHDAVMTPSQLLYFSGPDFSDTSGRGAAMGARLLERVYNYKPISAALTDEEAVHILGAQACMWSENIYTTDQAECQALPRLCALAEVDWTPDSLKNWDDFLNRMAVHYQRLDRKNLNYFIPPPEGLKPDNIFIDEQYVELKVDLPGAEIRFTVDGSDPSASSRLYTGPFAASDSMIVKARTFMKNGRYSQVASGRFRQQDPRPAIADTVGMQQGIGLSLYKGNISSLDQFAKMKFTGLSVVQDLSLPAEHPADFFGLEFNGFIRIPSEGVYTFTIGSDDGSRLYVSDELLIDNDGIHGARPVEKQISLSPGYHPFQLLYFDNQYEKELKVSITGPGFEEPSGPGRFFYKESE